MKAMKGRAARRGFTLVELMISLVAGVTVAIAVVGLARAATTTFYEQIRMSSVESSVRVASERLRNDLMRAGYMSTGNIKYDPRIAAAPGASNSRYTSTADLQSLYINVGGSTAAVKTNITPVKPDRIRIMGNLTGSDTYRGKFESDGISISFASISDPATSRLVNTANPLSSVKNVFTPNDTSSFLIRVIDKHRCQQFIELAANAVTSASTSGFTLKMSPDGGGHTILQQSDVSPVNCGANILDPDLIVSPVARVEWWLGDDSELSTATKAVVENQAVPEEAGFKFNLYRQFFDTAGNGVGKPEIVAEYGIDLKFGLVVHDLTAAAGSNQKTYDMDANAADITKWSALVSTLAAPGLEAPQRIRSVRYRIATRSAVADRETPLTVSTSAALSRYCVSTATPCKTFARVRTIVSEISLVNQERAFY